MILEEYTCTVEMLLGEETDVGDHDHASQPAEPISSASSPAVCGPIRTTTLRVQQQQIHKRGAIVWVPFS